MSELFEKSIRTLELPAVLELLARHAVSDEAKARCLRLRPATDAAAVEHLLELGHRKIAYIGDCSYESRYVGYCESLIRHNLPLNYRVIFPTDQSEEAGFQAMEKLLAGDEVTAVLCANDISAVGALRAAKGRRGKGVCVIAIDDIDQAQETRPMLTTVRIPREDMAHMAVALLKDRMAGGHRECLRVELPCRIMHRESVWPRT